MSCFTRGWLPSLFALASPLAGLAQALPPVALRLAAGRDLPARRRTLFHCGPSGALIGTTIRQPDPGFRPSTLGYRAGFEAGVAGNWTRGHGALHVAARYARQGYVQHDQVIAPGPLTLPVEATAAYRLNYLSVPVSVAYTQFANGQGVQVYAGGYAARFLAGRYEKTDLAPGFPPTTGRVRPAEVQAFGRLGGSEYVRPWDAGVQAGVGYRFGTALLQVGYAHGLRTLAPDVNVGGGRVLPQVAYYNQTVRLALTYFAFGARD
jgi:hypothetical protein